MSILEEIARAASAVLPMTRAFEDEVARAVAAVVAKRLLEGMALLLADEELMCGTSEHAGWHCSFCERDEGTGHEATTCPRGALDALIAELEAAK